MRRLLRVPGLHFLLIGGALFLASSPQRYDTGVADARPRIALTASDLGRLHGEWTLQRGAPPGPAAAAALVQEAIDEEVLYREALAAGLDRTDRLVRDRLVRLGRFVGAGAGLDDGAAEGEARRLGLERGDLVIRRRLVQAMRLAFGRLGPSEVPTEADLEAHLARHAERFTEPARTRLAHVYLARDRHGPALEARAARLLGELARTRTGAAAAARLGDPFLHGASLLASHADLDRIFGPGFADATEAAAPRTWVGPVHSSYGLHLLWVEERIPARVPPLAAVRTQVAHRLLAERREERLRTRLRALRARYEIVVDGEDSG